MAVSGNLGMAKYRKWILLGGLVLQVIGSILLPFGKSPDRYWRIIFPGLLFGTAGTALIYTQSKYDILLSPLRSLADPLL
jgi:hypothetical protein